MVVFYNRKHCFCGVYPVVSAVFVVSVVCFLFALHSLNIQNRQYVVSVANDGMESPNSLFGLDQTMFYIDKPNYRIAIGYEHPYVNDMQDIDDDESEAASSTVMKEQIILNMRQRKSNEDATPLANRTSYVARYDDESIDQNPVDEKYKNEINGKVSKLQCSLEAPLTNIVLLKTHRTGSTSIGNILYRYGDFRNLSFVLPSSGSFQYYWPLRFHSSHTRLDLLNKAKPNMAINIGRYSRRNILPMMPNNTVVLTILRDPVRHFESVYEYADISRLTGLWNTSRDPFAAFLEAPRNNVIEFVKDSKTFAIELNLLKNGMAFDLGLEHSSYSSDEEIEEFISKIDKELDFVIITEFIDESLVLLKRMLCWQVDDIIYIRHKVRSNRYRNNITAEQKATIQRWNKADVFLYDHFNKSLWDKIEQQGTDFFDELENFRAILNQFTTTCFEENQLSKSFELPITMKRIIPTEMRQTCERLMLRDKDYIKILKEKQRSSILEDNLKLFHQRFYQDSKQSRIYYAKDNSTAVNETSA